MTGFPAYDPLPPGATLAQQLQAARHHLFVGRAGEIELFNRVLRAPGSAPTVLFVHGPGGVGKTALLHEFTHLCRAVGITPILLDARDLRPTPEGFREALQAAARSGEADPAFGLEGNGAGRTVLLLDTYELLEGIDAWLRDRFLPGLPAGTLLVVSGRNPPSPGWRRDPGWREFLQPLPLRNLTGEEGRALLRRRGVDPGLHPQALDLTYGHPLALTLVADVVAAAGAAGLPERLDAAPDVVRALLEGIIEVLPGPTHRAALETCAKARVTTEALLREALQQDDVHREFAWLRSLSFIEEGPFGLYPHDLTREVIEADLRWRDPERHAALHRRVRGYCLGQLAHAQGRAQQRAFYDFFYLHRTNPLMRSHFFFDALGSVRTEPAGRDDHPAILAMTEAHEGPESAAIAGFWLHRRPEAFVAVRGDDGELRGYLAYLRLHEPAPDELAADPVVAAAWAHVKRHAPLRPGEEVALLRFMIDRATHQKASPVFNEMQVFATLRWLTTPKLAWSFLVVADAAYWHSNLSYIDFHRAAGADAEVGGRSYSAYAHDWRAVPVLAWLDLMGERELNDDLEVRELQSPPPAALAVLAEEEFVRAVKRGLRDFRRPAALATNPLLRSRLAAERSHGTPTAATLRELLDEAAQSLRETPRQEKQYRAVLATYLEPAATQELAAERLGLPFSTYRRHLAAGILGIAQWLWRQELREAGE